MLSSHVSNAHGWMDATQCRYNSYNINSRTRVKGETRPCVVCVLCSMCVLKGKHIHVSLCVIYSMHVCTSQEHTPLPNRNERGGIRNEGQCPTNGCKSRVAVMVVRSKIRYVNDLCTEDVAERSWFGCYHIIHQLRLRRFSGRATRQSSMASRPQNRVSGS